MKLRRQIATFFAFLGEVIDGPSTSLGAGRRSAADIPAEPNVAPAMERAVRSYLPVVESDPAAAAAIALQRVTDALLPLLTVCPSQAA